MTNFTTKDTLLAIAAEIRKQRQIWVDADTEKTIAVYHLLGSYIIHSAPDIISALELYAKQLPSAAAPSAPDTAEGPTGAAFARLSFDEQLSLVVASGIEEKHARDLLFGYRSNPDGEIFDPQPDTAAFAVGDRVQHHDGACGTVTGFKDGWIGVSWDGGILHTEVSPIWLTHHFDDAPQPAAPWPTPVVKQADTASDESDILVRMLGVDGSIHLVGTDSVAMCGTTNFAIFQSETSAFPLCRRCQEKKFAVDYAPQPSPAPVSAAAKLSKAQRRALEIVEREVWVLNTNGTFYHSKSGFVANKDSEIAVGKSHASSVTIKTINKLCDLGLLTQVHDNHIADTGRVSYWRTVNCYAITDLGRAALSR